MQSEKAVNYYEEGRLLHQKGKLSNAERAYKKAIKTDRKFVEAHNNLGNVLLDLGRLKEASNAYRKALKILPDHAMLLNNLGNTLQLQGENEEAIRWLNKAIIQDPNYADAHSNLGNALRVLGNIEEAVISYKHAIRIDPGLADTYNNLGSIMMELDELDDAFTNFNKAIEIDPRHKDAYNGLGNALSDQGELTKAIASYRKAIEIDPRHKDAYNGLGKALSDQGELDQAIAAYWKAIEIDPSDQFVYSGLGNALSDHGEIDKAIASYRKAIEIDPEYAAVYRSLSRNKKFSEYDDDIHSMESLYASKALSDEKKMSISFGLGKAYEDLGEYGKSMDFIIEATGLKRTSIEYSISKEQDLFCNIKEIFSLTFFSDRKGIGHPDQTPIFVLGMPRSGTSLVEQILASHPDVFGAGELLDLTYLTSMVSVTDPSRKYPECIVDFDFGAFEKLGKEYLARIRNLSKDKKHITDKMPHNFLRIGFIRAILPNAKVINCNRDPMDNCLSIFKTYFSKGHHYSYDMTELGQYYNLYLDLMEYWRNTLPGSIYDLSYEKLVADQEDQVAKLLDHCNLPWNDACLDFHKTSRKVKTASNAQVRRPIYKDSVKLWKSYEKQLKPLQRAIYE